MPRLPTTEDMGTRPVPQAYRGKPIVVPNAGAVADAAAGIGAAAYKAGEDALARDDEFRLEKARSEWLIRQAQIESEASTDQDFDTLEQRTTAALAKARTDAGTFIRSKRGRATFETLMAPTAERTLAGVRERIVAGRRDIGRASTTDTVQKNHEAALQTPDDNLAAQLVLSSVDTISAARGAGWISAQEQQELRTNTLQKFAKDRLSLLPDEKQVELLGKEPAKGSYLAWLPTEKRKALFDDAVVRVRTEKRAQRAELRASMQGAVDDAEETLRLANDGVSLPMEKIDGAIANATAAGRDSLVYGLKAARIKVAASAEYQSATPTELQDAVNELELKITKAGTKSHPGDVILRDHLITMRDKMTTQLNADPLSEAPKHGIAVEPLDWDSPASLGARLKAARVMSKSTGAPFRPLTDEEATPLKAEIERGPAGKLSALDKIKRFGPMGAVEAARQLAPDDEGFRVAASLATLPHPSVAAATSRAAIMGADELAANPALFDESDARKNFDGPLRAMRLLPPDMKAGVYKAARNIVAANLSKNRITKWDDDYWAPSISMALGGYLDRGVKRGGLGTWRGEPVLLPYGWSQGEMEGAISKATPAGLSGASNGIPVYRDGSPVPLNRLKQLQMVATGDGSYRLMDGAGFIARKGGGAFVLNVRKLPR